jgi:hypothetical protein
VLVIDRWPSQPWIAPMSRHKESTRLWYTKKRADVRPHHSN